MEFGLVNQNIVMEVCVRRFSQLIELLYVIDIHQFDKDVLDIEAKCLLVEVDVLLEKLVLGLFELIHALHLLSQVE